MNLSFVHNKTEFTSIKSGRKRAQYAPSFGFPALRIRHLPKTGSGLDHDITFLYQLHDPADRTGIHFHTGQQVLIAPLVRFHGYAAFFDLCTLLDQLFDRVLVGIPGADFARLVIKLRR